MARTAVTVVLAPAANREVAVDVMATAMGEVAATAVMEPTAALAAQAARLELRPPYLQHPPVSQTLCASRQPWAPVACQAHLAEAVRVALAGQAGTPQARVALVAAGAVDGRISVAGTIGCHQVQMVPEALMESQALVLPHLRADIWLECLRPQIWLRRDLWWRSRIGQQP